MDWLTLFGLGSLGACLVCYALERRSHWYILGFAVTCGCSSMYGFMIERGWPFGIVEAIWTIVALRRWWGERAGDDRSANVAPR